MANQILDIIRKLDLLEKEVYRDREYTLANKMIENAREIEEKNLMTTSEKIFDQYWNNSKMQEKDIFRSIANADKYFRKKYLDRCEEDDMNILFPRWLSINFGIVVYFDISSLFSNYNEKPWREYDTMCFWGLIRCRDEEKATYFKLQWG